MDGQRNPATVRVAAARTSAHRRGGSFGSWSPLLKQVAAIVAFVLANLVLLSPVVVEVVPALVVAADVLVLAAAAFAFVLPRTTLAPGWELAVPVTTFVAAALLRL